jgi:hypothetical protein
VPHVFTLTHVWELPFGRGRRLLANVPAVVDSIIGGWSASGLFIWRSGDTLNLTLGRDVDDDGNTARDRPALLSGSLDEVYADGRFGRTQWLIPQQEAANILGTPADVVNVAAWIPKNALHSPATQTYDLSLLKRFAVTERTGLSIEANAFNLFNRANFARPGAVLSSPLFGVLTRTVTPSRQLQFGVKLVF